MMLDKMRKHSRSFLIYIFFGIIIAVFVINFGPQSSGCTSETSYAGQINGRALSLNDLNYAMAVVGLRGRSISEDQMVRLRAIVVDRLIVRELLATQARDRGLRISGKEINDMLLTGRYMALGEPRQLFQQGAEFDYDYFSRYVRYNWGITVLKFKEQQRSELLAEKMRLLLRASTKASSSEVERDYRHDNTRADLQYVRFDPADFRDQVQLDDDAIEAYGTQNAKEVKKRYERDKSRYTNLPEQVRAQLIALDWKKAGDEAKAQAQAGQLAKEIAAGADFGLLARKHSADATASQGGMVAWTSAQALGKALGLGTADQAALAKLKDGEVSAPLAGNERTLVIKLVGRRKGDVSLDQARPAIARQLMTEQRARQLAQQAAIAVIQKVKQGAKLAELVPADESAADDGRGQTLAPAPSPRAAEGGAEPKLQTTGPFAKSFEHLVPGIGISKEISRLAFSLAEGAVADAPVAVATVYYLVAIKERRDPDMEAFKKRAQELGEQYQDRKAGEALRQLELRLCEEAVKERRLSIDARVLAPAQPGDPAAKAARPPAYVPCQTLRMM